MSSFSPSVVPPSPGGDLLPRSKHIILPKYVASNHIWCEWCDCQPCRNIEFKDQVMVSDAYDDFVWWLEEKFTTIYIAKYWTPLTIECKSVISAKISCWCYERYAKHFSLPWGRGQNAQLPWCLKVKIRMTFRQPAKDLDQLIQEPFLYQLRNLSSTSDP